MITFTVQNKVISFRVSQPKPVTLVAGGSSLSFRVNTGTVNVYGAVAAEYTHVLSQVDVDNKFISLIGLGSIANKSIVQIFIDNCGIKLEYGVDYTITLENKIFWEGYILDGKLAAGDKLKVYY